MSEEPTIAPLPSLPPTSGFIEVEHTADWAYHVWGQDMTELFTAAAIGLYSLAGLQLVPQPQPDQTLELQGVDYESLLVAWLNELLYIRESAGLGLMQWQILQLNGHTLRVQITPAPVQVWTKYIKAATYNNLEIQSSDRGVEATLVLDV
jgi:SHS2 domain-containing protein